MAVAAAGGAANSGTGTSVTVVVNSVPAGATLVVGVHDRSESASVSADVTDNVNSGAYSLADGPDSHSGSTMRAWVYYRDNCSAGNTTITVPLSASVNWAVAACYLTGTNTAGSLDATAAITEILATTNCDTNTVSATMAGGILAFFATNNNSTLTADGTGEAVVISSAARAHLLFQAYGASGSQGIEATANISVSALAQVVAFKEPSAGGISIPVVMHHLKQQGIL